jgi:uncharacterized protein (TIGR00725 family)
MPVAVRTKIDSLGERKRPIAVVGDAHATKVDAAYQTAFDLGRNLASRGHYIICGGRFGVMEAVCKGCMQVGGTSIGVLPRNSVDEANPYCTIIIPTVLGNHKAHATRNRNSVIVAGALCVFAIAGEAGTANELKLAQANKRRIFGLHNPGNGWTPKPSRKGLFTSHTNLADALTACGNYMRSVYPDIVW